MTGATLPNMHYLAILAWGALLAITLVLASLLQAIAVVALVAPQPTAFHLNGQPRIVWRGVLPHARVVLGASN